MDNLKEILELNKKWLDGNEEGKRANLQYANLRDADLRDADLQYANLQGANLRDADLDYSIVNLSCKDLGIHIDDRQAIQRLYHLLYNVNYSKNISKELKDLLLSDELIKCSNGFHRVQECGEMRRKTDA